MSIYRTNQKQDECSKCIARENAVVSTKREAWKKYAIHVWMPLLFVAIGLVGGALLGAANGILRGVGVTFAEVLQGALIGSALSLLLVSAISAFSYLSRRFG